MVDKLEALSTTNWVIFRIISTLDKYDLKYPPLGYIVRTARNFCIDEFRKYLGRKKAEDRYISSLPISYNLDFNPIEIKDIFGITLEELLAKIKKYSSRPKNRKKKKERELRIFNWVKSKIYTFAY